MDERRTLPLLPLRGVILFPDMVVPLEVGRERSLAALDAAMKTDRHLVFVSQRDPRENDPDPDDLYQVGVVGRVKQLVRTPGGSAKVVVEGVARARVDAIVQEDPCFLAELSLIEEAPEARELQESDQELLENVSQLFEAYVKNARHLSSDATVVLSAEDPGRLADTIAASLDVEASRKQDVLETLDPRERLRRVQGLLDHQMGVLEIDRRINVRVRRQMQKSQREYYLREQLKAIQRELGETADESSEADELRARAEQKTLPEAVLDKVTREIDRLDKMPPMAAEAVVVRTYVDWLLELPWLETTEDEIDVRSAEAVLEADHYGLEKVKERILEYLAVRALAPGLRGPLLCLLGPPGVGKTSLAKSIARATNRKFVRVSLGGVRDEAEIRGHRRTYVGALPGRVLQGMRQAGSANPVFLLDEVDKMAMDFRGDPSAALLEVLDPEQNQNFSDHYVELAFDLSKVLFITTANVLHQIPRPLLDRMEVIQIPGYTEEEKIQIARRHLWPKALSAHGLKGEEVELSQSALRHLIRDYTREAGVRELERNLGQVLRKVARQLVEHPGRRVRVGARQLPQFLGPVRVRHAGAEEEDQIGVATGLAVTDVGGDVMPVEATVMPGKGQLLLTGQLGDVMQESARAGYSYVRSVAARLGIPEEFPDKVDIHVHVPAGSIPKDGPSAGVTMATALVSALTRQPVRADVAMTGEITLRGRVLPVGGIRDKILAAHRVGIKTTVVPADNAGDLEEVPGNVRRGLTLVLAQQLDDVLAVALRAEG
jgi:ATP-dependent Lon protease